MASINTQLPEDLQQQVEQLALQQQRKPTEIVEEAVRNYLDERSWVAALGYGRQRAEAVGIATEEGIDRAIADWRKQNPQHTP